MATGGGGAGFTVMVTCDVLAPAFSDNWNTYVPCISPVTVVVTVVGVVITGVLGPKICVYEYPVIVPVEPLPFKVTVEVGKVIV